MTPENIAENVKRLRGLLAKADRISSRTIANEAYPEAIQTINALMQMVGEMGQAAKSAGFAQLSIELQSTIRKAARIDQLAKGEK